MSAAENNVVAIPVWKSGSTAEEWFYEMAMIARQWPERFARVVVVFEEVGESSTLTRYHCRNTSTTELLGVLESGKIEVFLSTHGKLR